MFIGYSYWFTGRQKKWEKSLKENRTHTILPLETWKSCKKSMTKTLPPLFSQPVISASQLPNIQKKNK